MQNQMTGYVICKWQKLRVLPATAQSEPDGNWAVGGWIPLPRAALQGGEDHSEKHSSHPFQNLAMWTVDAIVLKTSIRSPMKTKLSYMQTGGERQRPRSVPFLLQQTFWTVNTSYLSASRKTLFFEFQFRSNAFIKVFLHSEQHDTKDDSIIFKSLVPLKGMSYSTFFWSQAQRKMKITYLLCHKHWPQIG